MSQAAITEREIQDAFAESEHARPRKESPDPTCDDLGNDLGEYDDLGNELGEYETPRNPGNPNRLTMWASEERIAELRLAKRARQPQEAPTKKKKKKNAKKPTIALAVTDDQVFATGPRMAVVKELGKKFDLRVVRVGPPMAQMDRADFLGHYNGP